MLVVILETLEKEELWVIGNPRTEGQILEGLSVNLGFSDRKKTETLRLLQVPD